MKIWSTYRSSLAVTLLFLVVTMSLFSVYTARTLRGNIDNHILSSEMFGVPAALRDHGLRPLYGPKESGWDGQFYYYMSNDLLARKDTPQHIDAPSYRYQRIGMSLLAAIVAKLSFQHWVSPATYFFTYLGLIAAATFAGARLLSRFGAHPVLILLWSFSVGTQLTLFNALPDAAADAFLILALSALFARRVAWSIVPFAFAALSREVYTVFPSAVLLFALLPALRGDFGGLVARMLARLRERRYYLLLIPGLVAVAWHVYVTRHFGIPPSAQATGILGKPLVAWFHSYVTALHNPRPDTIVNPEAVGLLLFLLVLVAAAWTSVRALALRDHPVRAELHGIAAGCLLFAVLYACFGPTVTGDYTGYFKAAAVFFYLIPLMLMVIGPKPAPKLAIYTLLVVAWVFTSSVNLVHRVLVDTFNGDRYTHISTLTGDQRIECFGAYQADVHVNKITMLKASTWASLFGAQDQMVINVALTNTGTFPFTSTRGFGSVFMSFHWNDASGKTVVDGTRSALPTVLQPGQTENVDVITAIPSQPGLTLRLSPVQEGCAWFYQANPQVGAGWSVTIDQ